MGYFEARNGRFSVFSDLAYLKIGLNGSMTRSRGVDALNASVGASAGLKFEMFIGELAAAYELTRWGATATPGSGTAIDIFAGARGWWQRADASLALSGTVNIGDLTRNADGTLSASKDVGWVDPLVGLRLRHQFAPGMNFVATGDVGGFGVGSKFSWQALAALNYDFCVRNNVTWSGMLGYKALFVDYSQGSGVTRYEYDKLGRIKTQTDAKEGVTSFTYDALGKLQSYPERPNLDVLANVLRELVRRWLDQIDGFQLARPVADQPRVVGRSHNQFVQRSLCCPIHSPGNILQPGQIGQNLVGVKWARRRKQYLIQM
jgi:YD repeat-containing protein